MNSFTPFEQKALQLLVAPMLGCKALEALLHNPGVIEMRELDDGYDLIVEHPKLPVDVIAIGSPKVVGQLGSIRVRYVIKIESHALHLFCRVCSDNTIPAAFRQSKVQISVS